MNKCQLWSIATNSGITYEIGVRLSRTSAISVSELIVADNLTVKESIRWLSLMDLLSVDLSPIIKKEIQQVLNKHGLFTKR